MVLVGRAGAARHVPAHDQTAFIEPTEGTILSDGTDIRAAPTGAS